MKTHRNLLSKDDALLLIVDYQEKLIPAISSHGSVTQAIRTLIQGMKILQVPILVTEQYPKGLGSTVSEIQKELGSAEVLEKISFSCCGDVAFGEVLQNMQRKQIVVAGIESHVCMLQTSLDLLANDYQVYVPIEATCSRKEMHRDNALQRMAGAGVILTNVESVLFELMKVAGTAEFKAIQKLIV